MNRNIYLMLSGVTLGLLLGTTFYIYNHKTTPLAEPPSTATSTEEIITAEDKNTLTTLTGKKIHILETNPSGESLSTVTITPTGFSTNTPIILETNKLTNFFLLDINQDTFEELILTTSSQGSGTYGDAVIFTTASNTVILPVTISPISEEDMKKDGLFEGYQGHDSFDVVNGSLVRQFPTYLKNDTNDNPTGPRRSIIYKLIEKNGIFSIEFEKGTTTPSLIATTTGTTVVQTTVASTTTTKPSPQTEETSPATVSAPSTVNSPLVGTSWSWISTVKGDTVTKAVSGDKFVLMFDSATKVRSTTDCNTLSGEYGVDENMIEFSPLVSTTKSCEASQEKEYASYFAQAVAYTVTSSELKITLNDKSIIVFKKK